MSAQIVPLDRPVLTSSSVCLGSVAKKYRRAAPSSTHRMLSLTTCPGERRGRVAGALSGREAASMVPPRTVVATEGGGPCGPPPLGGRCDQAPVLALMTLSNTSFPPTTLSAP